MYNNCTTKHCYGILSIHMAGPQIIQLQSVKMQPGFKQIVRMQQANLLQLSDIEFHSLIAEVERSPLFHRLYQKIKLIHYQRFHRTDIHPCFYQLQEDTEVDKGSLDIDSLLSNRENIIRQIEKLGVDKFKRFFLFPEPGITSKEIAGACDLKILEIENGNRPNTARPKAQQTRRGAYRFADRLYHDRHGQRCVYY